MAENKTKATEASVDHHLGTIEDAGRRRDCQALSDLMRQATRQAPAMWGPSIVGFGRYRYAYDSGRTGEMCVVGFAARKSEISLYGVKGSAQSEHLLHRLGKFKEGKGCLSIKRLADIDLEVLRELIVQSVAEREPGRPGGG